jgi:hypothetical protein
MVSPLCYSAVLGPSFKRAETELGPCLAKRILMQVKKIGTTKALPQELKEFFIKGDNEIWD